MPSSVVAAAAAIAFTRQDGLSPNAVSFASRIPRPLLLAE
jgi:hypothetical protein